MNIENLDIKGLSSKQVQASKAQYGSNQLLHKKEYGLLETVKSLIQEPMVLLLLATASIYFITGNTGDGYFMVAAIILVSVISIYQDSRSKNAIQKLKKLTQPKSKVIRDGAISEINSDDIVKGDFLIADEGTTITADGKIVHSNDFSVNESILTGESFSIFKDQSSDNNQVYMGTMVSGGLAIIEVSEIGNKTALGKIGKSLEKIKEEKTALETQISNFVKKMVIIGSIVFLIVWGINYINSSNILDSLLKALTLAMSILPEEIPVAFTTFMAMGAWRLMKMGVIVKKMKTVESLGSATCICVDKTGTITQNKMNLNLIYAENEDATKNPEENLTANEITLLRIAMFASEPIPFDPMEIALHSAYKNSASKDERPQFKMIHEYPLEGQPPMMTHIFRNEQDETIIAAKGAPEAIIQVSNLSVNRQKEVEKVIEEMASKGNRILAVGQSRFVGDQFPEKQQDLGFDFLGLLAFYDPPKPNIEKVFQDFYKAGIQVNIITGDNEITTRAIAKQIGFKGWEKSVSGEELMQLSGEALNAKIANTRIFTRMFPNAKLKIINNLKESGEVVAMTGDGVNDGPALKAAHIGIAMGKKGSEIAKQSASLILIDDDLAKMVDAIAIGRKIYTNLKKAIQYIISIHIPIILTVFLPLILGWIYPNIFSPVHIIFLELIMGPTCSIIYENEPMEPNSMLKKPRALSSTFFNWKELITSIIQGILITAGTLSIYQIAVSKGFSEDVTRSMVFVTLITANVFLTLINRSFYYSIIKTLRYKNGLVPLIIFATIGLSTALIYYPPFSAFFDFSSLSLQQLILSIAIGFLSTIWFEIFKYARRVNPKLSAQNQLKMEV